ncbi:MAG TPA: alpha/beta hydrolase [Fimbriimonadaceae bacterium]|nr:alpha/beta hydrolase [Fimbriimonadaceae bacterium]HRJ97687.1 alpha/beta hydrolase [Fimbriimonadaceae bacterium]
MRAAFLLTLALGFVAPVLIGGCAGSPPKNPPDFAGLVGVGAGREMYVDCRGTGSPTVVLIAGARGSYDDWTTVIEGGEMKPSPKAVLPQVARFTRVCAYDRPGTTRLDGSPTPTTPVAQPTSAVTGVADLHALLAASEIPGPYVLVAHSLGGTIAKLYASTYPDDVVGLVLVDPFSEFLKTSLSPAQWTHFASEAIKLGDPVELEAADYEASVAALRAAAPVRRIPVVILTADKQFEFGAGGAETWPAWREAHEQLAAHLRAKHITETHSSHGIQLEQPQLVVAAVRQVVDAVRRPETWK